jgi:FkbM family methyltransferase
MPVKDAVKRALRPFNFVLPARVYGSRFKVPILRGVGGSHRRGSEPWMLDALQRLFALSGQRDIVDVGVNIGQTLLKAKSIDRRCRYIGFEPNPFCIQFVNELIALNRFEHCDLLPVALSAAPGLIEFMAESEADSAASMVQDLRPGKKPIRRQYIPMLAFDDIAAQIGAEHIAIVKIDVEGAELEVLSGMRGHLRRCRPLVACEVLHAHTAAQLGLMHERNGKLTTLLADERYAALRIRKDGEQRRVAGLLPVSAFPDEVYDHRTSPAACDYLFVPRERVPEAMAAFRADAAWTPHGEPAAVSP